MVAISHQLKMISTCFISESAVNKHIGKIWTVIDRLLTIWKSILFDEIKQEFFQAVAVSVLLYGCTAWTLTKCLKKKLDGNYVRILGVILNQS